MSLIHFFNYLDYDNLLDLGLKFTKPIKSENNTYIAKLEKPIFFILPKSEILNVHQDSFGTNICRYIVNLEEHSEFLTFLDNLDSLCVNIAADYSVEWFNQKRDSKQLVSRYSNIYTLDEDEHGELVTCDIEVDDLEQLSDLNLYNEDDNINILVGIEGIEFYKQSFKWKLVIDSLIDRIGDEEEEEQVLEDDGFDFSSELEKSTNQRQSLEKSKIIQKNSQKQEETISNSIRLDKKPEPTVHKPHKTSSDIASTSVRLDKKPEPVNESLSIRGIVKNKLDKSMDKTSIATSEVINRDVISELAEDVPKKYIGTKVDTQSISSSKPLEKQLEISDRLSMSEIESIITQKKNESNEFLLNAERAKRAAEGLYQKGIERANEVKRYQERLTELSQISSISSLKK